MERKGIIKSLLLLSSILLIISCKNQNATMKAPLEVFSGEAAGFPVFYKKSAEEVVGIPAYKALLNVHCRGQQVDTVNLEFTLDLEMATLVVAELGLFPQIELPAKNREFFTEVRFKLQANSLVRQKLSSDFAEGDKSPIDILLHREIPNIPYYREINNYELQGWTIKETSYY